MEPSSINEYNSLMVDTTMTCSVGNNSPNLEHNLNSTWAFWYVSRKFKDHQTPYEERIKRIAEFFTVESFFNYYVFMKSATEIDRNTDLSMFKKPYKPLWEECPNSGIIFIRYKKQDDLSILDLKWEKLLFALIGEQFNEQGIIGTCLSIRGRETIIELWFEIKENLNKGILVEKFKEILSIDESSVIYFKDNSLSLKDGSTLKNIEPLILNKRKNTYL